MSDSSSDDDAQLRCFVQRQQRTSATSASAPHASSSAQAPPPPQVRQQLKAAFVSATADSDSDDEGEIEADDSDDEGESERGPLMRRYEEYKDSRGTYDRRAEGVGQRKPFAQYAYEHRQKIEQNMLGVPCTERCQYEGKCWMQFLPQTLLAAHERVYGSFAAFQDGKYTCAVNQGFTMDQHKMLMRSWITHTASDPPVIVERFFVEGRGPVCAEFACAVYDMHRCWASFISKARSRTLKDGESQEDAEVRSALTSRNDQAQFQTVEWWLNWLRLEDQMPNEPVIVHRNLTWPAVYQHEYCPDVQWYFSNPVALSFSRWYDLRKPAIKELSLEWFGEVAGASADDVRLNAAQRLMLLQDSGHGEPIVLLTLQKRAKHSNFGQCTQCQNSMARWVAHRTSPDRLLGDGEAVKREIFQHLFEVKLERKQVESWMQNCAQRKGWFFTLDDKCGSSFLHLPSPSGGRFTADKQGATHSSNVSHVCPHSKGRTVLHGM